MKLRVLVTGGRKYPWMDAFDHLQKFANDELCAAFFEPSVEIACVIHGNAKGADTGAEAWAQQNQYKIERYLAQWKVYGKLAGPERNGRMLRHGKPDVVLAFPGGDGTKNMIDQAKAARVPVVKMGLRKL